MYSCCLAVSYPSDGVYNYSKRVLETGMAVKALHSLCRSPDYRTFMSLLKFLLPMLHVSSSKSKYAIEISRYLVQHLAVFSCRLGHETFYRQFVNVNGTVSGHIPVDLQNEYFVKKEKICVRHMYSGQSDKNVERRSAALYSASTIAEQFDIRTGVVVRCQKHTTASSDTDEKDMIHDLRSIRPFRSMPNRSHHGLGNIKASCLSELKIEEYLAWMSIKQSTFVAEIAK